MIKLWLLSLLTVTILCSPYVQAIHGGTQMKRVMLSMPDMEQQASSSSSLTLRRLLDDVLDDADTNDEDPQAQVDGDLKQTVTNKADTAGLNGDNDEDLGTDDFDIPGDQDNVAGDADNAADDNVQADTVKTDNVDVVDADDADNDADNTDNTDDNATNDLDEDEMELQAKEAAAAAGNGGRDGEGDGNNVDPDNLDDPYEDFGNPDDDPEGGVQPGKNSTTDSNISVFKPADGQQQGTVDKDAAANDTETDEHLKAALDADDEDDADTNNSDQIRNGTLVLPNGNGGNSTNGADAKDDWDTEVQEDLTPVHRTIPDDAKVNGTSTANTTVNNSGVSKNATQPVTAATNTTTAEKPDSVDKLQPVANNNNDGKNNDEDGKTLDDDAAKWQDDEDQDEEQQGPTDTQPTENQQKTGEVVDGQPNDDNDNVDADVNGDDDPQADVVDTEDEAGQGQKVVVDNKDGGADPGDDAEKFQDNDNDAEDKQTGGDDVLDNGNDDVDDPNNVDNGPADQDADANDAEDQHNNGQGDGNDQDDDTDGVDNDQQQQPEQPGQQDQQGKDDGLNTGRTDDNKDKDDEDALIEDDEDNKDSELVTDSAGSGSGTKEASSGQSSGKSTSMFSTVTAAAGLSFKWAMKDEVILYTGSIAFLALLLAGFAIGKRAFSKVKSLKRSSDGYLPISNTDKGKDPAIARQASSRIGSPKIVWDDWNDNDAGAWDAAENGKGRGGAEHFAAPARYRTTAQGSSGGGLHSIGSGAVDFGPLSPRVSLLQTRPSMPGSPTHASSAVRSPGSPHRAATTDGRTARVARSEKKSTLGATRKQKQQQPQTDSSDSR